MWAVRGEAASSGLSQAVKSVPVSLQTKRFETARLATSALACCALLAASACTKTSDGSIELNKVEFRQPAMPNLFKLRFPGWRASQPAPVQSAAAPFPRRPAAPQQVARAKPAPAKTRPQSRPAVAAQQPAVNIEPAIEPAATTEPSKPLVCRDDSKAAGRIRVVCN
jgi:hypothetical protein